MISTSTIESVSNIARSLTDKGTLLDTVKGTALGDLVQAIVPPKIKITDDYSADKLIHEMSAVKNLNGDPIYDSILNDKVDLCVTAILNSIDVARNTINPMIIEFDKRASTAVENHARMSTDFNIVPIGYPTIFSNPALDELTAKYDESGFVEVSWQENAWPILDTNEIRNAISSKVTRLQKDIDNIHDHLTDYVVVAIYDFLFRNRPLNVSIELAVSEYIPIVGFLLASNWLDNCPDGVKLSKEDLDKSLTDLKVTCAYKIQSILHDYGRKLSQGTFILKVDNHGRTVSVRSDIYAKWLENGGTPELLIGAILSGDRPPFNMDETLKKRYLTEYNQDRKLRDVAVNDKIGAVITKTAKDYIMASIEESPVSYKGTIKNKLQEHLKSHPYRKGMCQNKWIRMVICKTMFSSTNALQILETIDSVKTTNDSMTTREAATMATIELLADWLVDSMVVENGH